MKHIVTFAIIFIAICALSTRATSQSVYRCGNTYSQTPCADGVEVNVQDDRTAAQKAESQAIVRRETSTANAMEKARLREEARLRASINKKDKSTPTAADVPVDGTDTARRKSKPTKALPKKKTKPEYFTARGAAPEKPKSGASKSK